jgi:hypothetical protein
MNQITIDQILYTQLIIARLGEKELKNWWNTDIAYETGGADFLKRLVGEKLAPLSAAEAILSAAFMKEHSVLSQIPSGPYTSLFCLKQDVDIALKDRIRHFKRYPDDTPEDIATLMDPITEWTIESLKSLLGELKAPDVRGTSFGNSIEIDGSWNELDTISALAAVVINSEKGRYTIAYTREAQC